MANRFEELTLSQRRANDELSRLASQLKSIYGSPPPPGPSNGLGGPAAVSVNQPRPGDIGLNETGRDETQHRLDSVNKGLIELANGLTTNTSAIRESATVTSRLATGLTGRLVSEVPSAGGVSTLLRSGLGLASLGSAIAGLFRSKEDSVPDLQVFTPPAPRHVEAANGPTLSARTSSPEAAPSGNPSVGLRAPSASIVVNVNALDSRSFMDRSSEIASAVREAMLHAHPVNDVVSEL